MSKFKQIYMKKILLIFLGILLFGCSKDKETIKPGEVTKKEKINGVVEKGPFIQGSKVTLIDLDSEFNPTGKTYETKTTDDLGSFEFKEITLSSGYARLDIDGFYFDEVRGKLSTSRIVLNAIAQVDHNKINVNLFTHIETNRILKLLKQDKLSFAAAKKQAAKELLTGLGISSELTLTTDQISLTDGNEDAASLLALSVVLLNNPDHSDAVFTELLSKMSKQLEMEGNFKEDVKSKLRSYAASVNPAQVKSNLINRYKSLGLTVTVLEDKLNHFLENVEIIPPTPTPGDIFWADEQNIMMAYSSACVSYATFMEKYYVIEALQAPAKNYEGISKQGLEDVYKHQVNADNSFIADLWLSAYRGIREINQILKYTKTNNTASVIAIRKDAAILSAHLYYIITEIWGNAPLIDQNEDPTLIINKPRSTIEEIRQSNVNTLKNVLDGTAISQLNMSQFGKMGFLANGILAKYNLQKRDYPEAKKYLDLLLNDYALKLADKSNIYNENYQLNEAISGYNSSIQTSELFKSENFILLAKKGTYVSFMRTTEIVLMAAEVEMQLGNFNSAVILLNKVRSRNAESPISVNNKEELTDHLLKEYKTNLGMEGVYFSALKRLGKAETTLGIPFFRRLMPIPLKEMITNSNLQQNPGY